MRWDGRAVGASDFLLSGQSENLYIDHDKDGNYALDLKFAQAYLLLIPPQNPA